MTMIIEKHFRCWSALFSTLTVVSGAPVAFAQDTSSTQAITVIPLTQAAAQPPIGYFQDPFLIRLHGAAEQLPIRLFSGTTKSLLVCPASLLATCAAAGKVTLKKGSLVQQASAAGATLGVADNFNIFVDDEGNWHMIATYYVTNPSAPPADGPWTVVVHAHPVDPNNPLHWSADALLAGSLTTPAPANYDGKLFLDGSTLYLVYSKNLSNKPQPRRDGLVAQRMISPSVPASDKPVLLLEPKPGAGYASERFDENEPPDTFKLVETGNITKIDGKYALAYSTGAFDERDYKSGVAWSDTFLPSPGTTYRKVLKPDPDHVWSTRGPMEVRYLVQSQKPNWPNDVADQVLAPGVPSIIKGSDGTWRLVFAGYAPSGTKFVPGTNQYDPTYRRPYAVRLRLTIQTGATVASASDAELARWMTPTMN